MGFWGRALIAASLVANTVVSSTAMAADQQYFFRYKTVVSDGNVDPGLPQEADITARFVGVVGFPFSEKMPLVAGKTFSSWKITSGTLPEGLTFDTATGTVSGQPTAEGKGFVVIANGYGTEGEPAGSARIEIDVFKPSDGYKTVDFYGHTNHYALQQLDIPSGMTVDHWNVIYAPPPGIEILGRNYDGTPTKAGRYPIAVQGFDYLDREIILLTGYYLVEDGPTFPQVADDIKPIPNMYGYQTFTDWPPYVRSVSPSSNPNIRFNVEVKQGDVLPGTIQPQPITGRLSGAAWIPYQTATVRWKATDTDGTTGYSNWWRIGTSNPQPDFSAHALGPFNMVVGNYYEIPFSVVGTPGTKSFSIASGTLPEGLTLDTLNGIIKGTPAKDETQTGIRLHLAVTNSGTVDEKDSVPFTMQVAKADVGLRISSQDKQNVRIGESFQATLEKWGDVVQPASVEIDPATPLPAGVSFDPASLTVSGSVSASGQQLWHFVLTNGDGRIADASIRLGVYAPLSLSNGGALTGSNELVDAQGNVAIPQYDSYTPIASVSWPADAAMPSAGGVSPTFSVVGSMPAGISIDQYTGIISGGTKAVMGSYGPFAVQIADGSGDTALGKPFYINVTERRALQLSAKDVTFHSGLQEQLSAVATLAQPPLSTFMNLTWTLTGDLPEGLAFDRTTGLISGTPADLATYDGFLLSVQDEDGAPYAGSSPFSIHVDEAAPITAKAMAPSRSTVGYPISIPAPVFLNTIGDVSYAAQGTLPAGLALDPSTGSISGTPSETFSGNIVIVATDGQGRSGSASVQTTILALPTVEQAEGSALEIARLETKTFSVKPTNLVGTPSFTLVAGTLPAGLSFSAVTGAISGTATKEGVSGAIVIGMTDAATGAAAQTDPFTISVGPRKELAIAYNSVTVYDDQPFVNLPIMPTVQNASGAVAFTVRGAVPAGLAFDTSNGFLRGQPTTPGTYPLTVSAVDGAGSAATANPVIRVSRFAGLNGPASVDGGTWRVAQPFTTPSPAYTNGIGDIVYASASTFPDGASLDPATGSINGVVATAGSYEASVNARDADNRPKWGTDTVIGYKVVDHLAIAAAPSSTSTTQYPSADLSLATTVSNAIGNVTYSLSGTLPLGVTFNGSTGLISGKPQAKGTFANLVVTATDSHDGETAITPAFSITVLDRVPLKATLPTIATTLANHDILKIAQPTVTGAANGESVTYSYSGTLPAGITFDASNGTFHGKATVLGDFPGITVTVTDSKGASSVAGPMTIRSVLDGNAITLDVGDIVTKVGYPFTTGVPTTANTIGAQHFYSYDIVPQIKLNTSTGEMTGVFNSVQDFDFDLYVGDETSRATSERIKVQVLPALRVVVPTVVSSRQADALTQAVDTFYRAGTVVYSKGAGTWPAGISVDPSTGALTGTPTAAVGDYAGLTIKGVDSFGAGNTDTQFSNVFTIKVQAIAAAPIISDIAGGKMIFGTVGQAATPFTPTVVDSKFGKPWNYGDTVYSLNRVLPAGLSFDTTTGTISGTPTEPAIIPDLVITVTSQAGDVDATAPFWFGVKPAGNIAPTVDQTFTYTERVGNAFATNPPLFDNTFGAVTYSMTTSPGRGTFNTATGIFTHPVIYATDVGTWPMIVVVTDAFGRQGTLSMTLKVVPGITMTVPKASVPVTPGSPTNALNQNAPTVAGVLGALTFSATGLPQGMSVDSSTGALTGAPPVGTAHGTTWAVTVTARDTTGATYAEASATYSITALVGGYQFWRVADNQSAGYPQGGQNVMGGFVTAAIADQSGLSLLPWLVTQTVPPVAGDPKVFAVSGINDGYHVYKDASGYSWKQWKFTVPVNIGSLTLTGVNSWTACNSQMTKPILQYSTNGASWTTAKAFDWPACTMNITMTYP